MSPARSLRYRLLCGAKRTQASVAPTLPPFLCGRHEKKARFGEFERNTDSPQDALSPRLVMQAGEAFLAAKHLQHIENSWRRRPPGERGAQRLRGIA